MRWSFLMLVVALAVSSLACEKTIHEARSTPAAGTPAETVSAALQ